MRKPRASGAGSAEQIRNEQERWERETLEPCVERAGERLQAFTTQSVKWPIKSLYTPLDLGEVGFDYLTDCGFPGEFPYTRGTEANGYRTQLWTMSQVSGFGTGADSARRWRSMLDRGLNGLIIEYDLATTNGFDSDHPLAAGEVCRAGTAIFSFITDPGGPDRR